MCGLLVELERLAYAEDLCTPDVREWKLWFASRLIGGTLRCDAPEATRKLMLKAKFLSPAEFVGKIAFPPVVHAEY